MHGSVAKIQWNDLKNLEELYIQEKNKTEINNYYMPLSHKDWELPNS